MNKVVNPNKEPILHAEKTSFGKYDEFGRFLPDARQMEAALSMKAGPTLIEQMREMIRGENLAKEARQAGFETFEEANDFFVEEDPDSMVYSPYELDEDYALETALSAARAGVDVKSVAEQAAELAAPDDPPALAKHDNRRKAKGAERGGPPKGTPPSAPVADDDEDDS